MPFSPNTYFNPSEKLRELWSLVPQARTLLVANKKTRPYHSGLSSAIPIFYVLMFLAILFDIYLGFFILSKQGVSMGLVVGSVIADLFLGMLPFLVEGVFLKNLNHTKIDNMIFWKGLESTCKIKGETDEEYQRRRIDIEDEILSNQFSYRRFSKIYRFLVVLVILSIAFWKIYTFMNVLPPSISIWAVVKGKIIIIFSLLTALFHLIGTEKAVAHFFFSRNKKSELKRHRRIATGKKPEVESIQIKYEGNFVEAKKDNTSIVKKGDNFYLEFIHVIRDGEIQSLVNAQTDPIAKKAVAVICKENQIL